jgi:hypothetical protein
VKEGGKGRDRKGERLGEERKKEARDREISPER